MPAIFTVHVSEVMQNPPKRSVMVDISDNFSHRLAGARRQKKRDRI